MIDIVTGIAETRDISQYLIDKYQDRNMRDRAFELSWTHSQVVLRQINATEAGCGIVWTTGQFRHLYESCITRQF